MSRFFKPKVNLSLAVHKTKVALVEHDKKEAVCLPAPIDDTVLLNLKQDLPSSSESIPVQQTEVSIPQPVTEELQSPVVRPETCVAQKTEIIELIDLSSQVASAVDIDTTSNIENTDKESPKINLFAEKKKEHQRRTPYRPTIKNNEPLDRSSVMIRDLIYWVPTHNPPPKYRQQRNEDKKQRSTGSTAPPTPCHGNTDSEPEVPPDPPTTSGKVEQEEPGAIPQLKLDADGNIVLDEASLVVKSATHDVKMGHVFEDVGDLSVNSRSFRHNRGRTRKWTEKEVVHFYKALSTIGTDFSSMAKMFKSRDREDLKKKFKREEKKNPHLIDRALKSRRSYDLSVFHLSSSEDEASEDNPVPELAKRPRKRKAPKDGSQKVAKRSRTIYENDNRRTPVMDEEEKSAARKRIEESIENVLARNITESIKSRQPNDGVKLSTIIQEKLKTIRESNLEQKPTVTDTVFHTSYLAL